MGNIETPIPSEDPQKTSITKTTKIIENLGLGIAFFGLIVFLVFEKKPLENIINGESLWLTSILVGLSFFIIIIVFLKKKYTFVFDERRRRFSVYFYYLTGAILCVVDLASFINTTFANPLVQGQNFIILQKYISSTSKGGTHYYIDCNDGRESAEIEIDELSWGKLQKKDTIELYLKKGYFGMDYVATFTIPEKLK